MKERFTEDLRQRVRGSVKDDEATLIAYRVDASIFEIEPIAVFLPLSKEDLLAGIKVAKAHGMAIIPRGAATGITGGCLGKGLVIDLSLHLNRILKINIAEEFAIVEPGVVQDDLNSALKEFGYRLGPETSTGNRATLGGMLANNAAGSESLKYGCMADHILEVELALSDGESILLKKTSLPLSEEGNPLMKKIALLREKYKDAIQENYPKIPRISSGYRLDRLISDENAINFQELIAGSEGTLGVITELKVKIVKNTGILGIVLLEFEDMIEAMEKVPEILAYSPLSLELIDDHILESAKKSRTLKKSIPLLTNPKAVLIVQFDSEDSIKLSEKVEAAAYDFRVNFANAAVSTIYDKEDIDAIRNTRKAGLGLLLSKRDFSRAVAFIEDLSIPPASLAPFMRDFKQMLAKVNKTAGIYGHAGSGCLHIRPYMDLRSKHEQDLMVEIMHSSLNLILKYGGALSGEHGDGLIRSSFNQSLFGKELFAAFCALKEAFDPLNLMNPGKIVGTGSPRENLRHYPDMKNPLDTYLDFSPEGGFELSADLCNGNGLCRKKEGVMCPSFQATRNEYDTTRARAEMLRAYISKEKGLELSDNAVLDILDLCLMCKGCKKECPSQVDMAKMKAEVLYQAARTKGRDLRTKIFGHMGTLFAYASFLSPLIKLFKGSNLEKRIKKALRISLERELPLPEGKRFSSLYKKRSPDSEKPPVILFNDTFNEFLHPRIGMSAAKVLEHHGFSVIVPPYRCCGRTFISKGILEKALHKSVHLVKTLYPYAMKGIPIIGLEPSCILTLRDETLALIAGKRPDLMDEAGCVAKAAVTFEEFFSEYLKEGSLRVKIQEPLPDVLLHTHCHEMALIGREPARHILKNLALNSFQEIPEGCCGMAGSFGYEEEHFDISLKIANLKLFPAIKKAPDALIVASGTSCRSQILFGEKKEALHMAEFLHLYLD